MAELFIEALVVVLFEKLASGDVTRLVRSANLSSELNKWTDTLTQIQAVLVDASQKHIRDKPVQLWLNKLQHLAYEIDDAVDDLVTEATRHQLNQESYSTTSKVLKFVPSKFHTIKYRHKMSSKLKGITTKLDGLVREKQLLGLNDNVARPDGGRRRLEETSLVDESEVMGRDGDKEVLLKTLLDGESSSGRKFSVLSIVGMGGAGKTTLARLLYNDEKVKAHYELRAWVCVSDVLDVFNISMTIFQAVGGGNKDFANLDLLQVALSEKLSKKKFLLVLDDVWNENHDDWECLQRPFAVGADGSKILVTTRKMMVAQVMDSVEAFHLKLLSDEDALTLFTQYASSKQTFDVNGMLKLHGKDIVKKCGKLPLALKTVGRAFRTKSTEEEWEELLNSEIWSLGDENDIVSALTLSYYELPTHLKQMFTYCCLFPKDHEFDKDELVLLWMAEGFLNPADRNMSMESFGRECFEKLVSRSFLQRSANNESRYTMHDLISDLATSVGGEFFFMMEGNTYASGAEVSKKFHHLSFIRERHGTSRSLKALQGARGVRTFLAMSRSSYGPWESGHVSNKVLTEVLPQLQLLRVLSLPNHIISEVPKSIGNHNHIRYLNFSNTSITSLPEQVGNLLNLQSLLLARCYELSSLPNSIAKLIHLRHLDIRDTPELHKLPSLGALTSLRTLSKVIIGGAGGELGISDLKDLLHLQGELSIEGLHRVKSPVDAREANLLEKKGICDLAMEWSDVFDDSRSATTEHEVLEGLRPFKKLRSLKILYYGGKEFPSWVGDQSFAFLTDLTLKGCRNCTFLPKLGHLPLLQRLSVQSIHELKKLGPEFLGDADSCDSVSFQSLEFLKFEDMESWEEWSTVGGDKGGAYPRLHEIHLINCSKLDVVAIGPMPSLKVLVVHGCCLVVLRSMVGLSSSTASLTAKNIRGLTQFDGEDLEHLKAVEYLDISGCDDLIYLWESDREACERLGSLQKLNVRECGNLVSLGKKDDHLKIPIESVRKVKINRCGRLRNFNCPNSIEKLKIIYCISITSLSFPTMDGGPSTLKTLYIEDCENIEVSWPLNSFLSSLECLQIARLPNLKMLPAGCLVHLTELSIYDCDNIESIPEDGCGFLPTLCLRSLVIYNCKNLMSFPHQHLQSLTSLKSMKIRDCPSLDDSFPCGLWPPNLTFLGIGGLKKPISEWGHQNFPSSLVYLELNGGNSGVTPFAAMGEERNSTSSTSSSSSFLLPSSLTSLHMWDFEEVESVSEGMQHLTSLQHLEIGDCPKLRHLPETLLPSLSSLRLYNPSSQLRKKCSRKGKYWSTISQIPQFYTIDNFLRN